MKDRKAVIFGWEFFLAALLIFLGSVLRVREYLALRSLWLDEAMLALSIVNRDFAGIFFPLDYEQGAPIGFLLVEKFVVSLLGENELRLRLFPLFAGCLALVFGYLFARKVLSSLATLFFLAAMAISPTLIYYSSEVKQYSSDVLFVVLLAWLSVQVFGQQPAGLTNRLPFYLRYDAWLFFFGAIAIWFSHPAAFVVAAIGIVWFLRTWIVSNQSLRAMKRIMLVGFAWFVSFVFLYLFSLRYLADNQFLLDYWRENFVRFDGRWLGQTIANLFSDVAGLGNTLPLFVFVSLLGLAHLWVRRKDVLGLICLTFSFTLLASMLEKYPFHGRLMLFSVPLLFVLLAAGLDFTLSFLSRKKWLETSFALMFAGLILSTPLTVSWDRMISPRYYDHVRPAIVYLSKNLQPGDNIYVYYWTVPVVRYYSIFHPYSEEDIFAAVSTSPSDMFEEVQNFSGQPRVWLIFSHLSRKRQENMEHLLVLLNQVGEQKDSFSIPGTGVFLYLYDFSLR